MEPTDLKELFKTFFGFEAERIERIAASGSNRRYYRMSGRGFSVIGTAGDEIAENRAFIYLSKHLREHGVNVPAVLAVSEDERCYIQEDLGDDSVFGMLPCDDELLGKCMELLAKAQLQGGEGLDWEKCFPVREMNHRSIMWDLNYFKYCFLKGTGVDFGEPELEDDFERLAAMLLDERLCKWGFMVRDFQSRNVMVKGDDVWLIDFQGGRRGPIAYDVASFLWQARAGFIEQQRLRLVEKYLDEVEKYVDVDREQFRNALKLFVLFRTLQVLGAYGFRGLYEGKVHFRKSIPAALTNLRGLLDEMPEELGYLREVLQKVCESPKFKTDENSDGRLVVRVVSFSYMRGLPDDASGNGGGFVFDCRAVHNPGRYEEYKRLTGRDEAVRRFLEDDGEIFAFLDCCKGLVGASVERYLKRGFRNLMVCFGCTGGQHRSVYSAERMARWLNEKYGVEVLLEHREQGITEKLESRR